MTMTNTFREHHQRGIFTMLEFLEFLEYLELGQFRNFCNVLYDCPTFRYETNIYWGKNENQPDNVRGPDPAVPLDCEVGPESTSDFL